MGGTSIVAALDALRPVQPFGEWTTGARGSCLTRCWVLRDRATEPSETEAREHCAHGLFGRGPVTWSNYRKLSGKHRERPDSRPYLENCTVDASI